MKTIAAFLIIAMLLTGCTALTAIPVTHLASLHFVAPDVFPRANNLVVRDPASWQNLWTEMTQNVSPAPALPTVDFSKDMVLVAAAGASTGLSIAITGAGESSTGEIVVGVTITRPGNGCAVAQIVTSPVDIATIPRSDASVVFKTISKEHNCS